MFSDRARDRLRHIVENADWIAEYLEGFDLRRFQTDRRTADAVERCIARISEAVIQLGQDDSERAGLSVPWHDVRSFGNRLRHDYARIDRKRIYETACDDIPPLRDAAVRALAAE